MYGVGAQGVLSGMDGAEVPYYAWGEDSSKAALVFLHGAGPYGRWYEALARALARDEVAVLAIDQRGFGSSTGPRGHSYRFHTYLDDCSIALSAAAARWPQASVALGGHSFGGLVALRYCSNHAGRRGPLPHKLVLVAPWIKDVLPISFMQLAGGLFNAIVRPTKSYRVPISIYQTGDPANMAVLQAFERDPLVVHEVTARWFAISARAKIGLFKKLRDLRLPVLQVEGTEDALIDRATNRKLFTAIGSRDKQLIVLPGVYHDAQFQADIDLLAGPVSRFLRDHDPRVPA